MSVYQVSIPAFHGPLDLLIHLIEKNEIDIYNIPIAFLTEQYLEHLSIVKEMDLELTSEFLVMACNLLLIKAKMLLPKQRISENDEYEKEEDDPRQELVLKLLEYKQYKEKAEVLKAMELEQAKVFVRQIDMDVLLKEFSPPDPIGGAFSIADLMHSYEHILGRIVKRIDVVSIERHNITIQNRIEYVLSRLHEKPSGVFFTGLFSKESTKEDIIVTFLALLELVRQQKVRIRQDLLFQDIFIFISEDEGGE